MKVSAIVSAYYAEQFIQDRLDNLAMQAPMPELVVLTKRGSKEEEITKEFNVDWYSHGIVKHIITDGTPTIYEAWNMGIKASKGEYVCNANSDDLFKPGALRRMAKVMDDNPDIGVVFSNVYVEHEDGRGNEWKRIPDETGPWNNPIETLINRCVVGPMPMWRKSLHDEHGYFDEQYRHAADYEMWLRFAFGGAEFYYINEALGVYRNRKESDEHKYKVQSVMETQMAQGDYLERLENE